MWQMSLSFIVINQRSGEGNLSTWTAHLLEERSGRRTSTMEDEPIAPQPEIKC